MDVLKEFYQRVVAEEQEQGLIPKLTPEQQKRVDAMIDEHVEEIEKFLSKTSLSELDILKRTGELLQLVSVRPYRPTRWVHQRHWRQKLAKCERGRGRRPRPQEHHKRFR